MPVTLAVNSARSCPAIQNGSARLGASPSCSLGGSAAATSAISSSAVQNNESTRKSGRKDS